MADDPTRYLDVSGVLALKAGSTVDVDYTVTHARSVVARLGELGARITDAAAESEARDDTLYEQVQQVRALTLPSGGLAGDFLTRTASGYSWTPPLYDDGGTVADLSGMYFIDNGDGTVTPAHATSYTDDGGTITMKGA